MAALIRSPGRCAFHAALLVACQTPPPSAPMRPTDSDSDTDEVPDTRPGTPCDATEPQPTDAYVWNEELNEEACLNDVDRETWCKYVPVLIGGGTPDCPTLDHVLTASGFLAGDPISDVNHAYGCTQDGEDYVIFYHESQLTDTTVLEWLIFDGMGFMVSYAYDWHLDMGDNTYCCDGRETEWWILGEVVWPRCDDPVSYGPEDFR